MTRIKMGGHYVYVKVLDYSPGTDRIITSHSTEPNDPEDFDYEIYLDESGEERYKTFEAAHHYQDVLREWKKARDEEQYE